MTVKPEQKPKKVRKNHYIPDLAAAYFKPTEDWNFDQAREEFGKAKFDFSVDRVSYGDCVDFMKKLPAESVDVVIADPPFGLGFTGKESIYNRDERFVRRGYREVEDDYREFSEKWIKELPRIMKKSGSAWIFSGWTRLDDILHGIKESGLSLINHIIWKYQFGVFTSRKFVTSHYHILFLAKGPKYYFNKIVHYPLDVWEIKRTYRIGEVKNSTKLPEELVAKCIEFSSRPGDLIFDPFMGNGTTAVAAKGTLRHYLGSEINKKMKDIIDSNVKSIKPGQFYVPYSERHDELVARARRRYGVLNEKELSIVKLDRFQS